MVYVNIDVRVKRQERKDAHDVMGLSVGCFTMVRYLIIDGPE